MPRAKRYRARDYGLELRPEDNHTIRLLASHLDLSLRETVHQIVTHYLSSHDIDLLRAFGDRSLLAELELGMPGGTGE